MAARRTDPLSHPDAFLEALCALDTTTGREAAILPALLPMLEALGAEVEVRTFEPGRCNVLATWGEPRILFTTHLDTVPPFLPPVRKGEALFGRGACDAKGQIVAQLLAAARLRDRGVAWMGVAGEETDSVGAQRALADWGTRFPACLAVINGEPTELKVATGQRGVRNLRLCCHGKAAHGGSPELGHSAVLDLVDWIGRIRALAPGAHPQLGPEVWNLGVIRGGTAVNIVPDRAEALLNIRTVPDSGFARAAAEAGPPGSEAEVQVDEAPSLFPELPGFDTAAVPFGSDAPVLRALAPTGAVALAGPGSIAWAHTADEHLTFSDLRAGADLNLRLALHFLQEHP